MYDETIKMDPKYVDAYYNKGLNYIIFIIANTLHNLCKYE